MEPIYIAENRNSFQTREAFKTLRSNVAFSGENVKKVCVTSAQPEDGKSTVSFELACAFAQSGKKTLLVDADLRKSVMRKYDRDRAAKWGLTHYLAGQCQANETICPTTIANFYMIFAGAFPPNPSELLGGEKFRALLEAAQKTFDMIIVDTPPVGSVIDAAVVSRVCDGVVLVLRDGAVSRRFAQRVKEQLDAAGAKILGCVLNDIKFSGNRYYSRYYGKHYGDYYGKQ